LQIKGEKTADGTFHQVGFTIEFRDRSKSNGIRRLKAIKHYFSRLPKTWKIFEIGHFFEEGPIFATSYWLNPKFIKEEKPIIDYFKPVISMIKKFKTSRVRAFLCHSSEDKNVVEDFAKRIKSSGSVVWFDKWEIKVGDSIVEKINNGLENMTHIVIFLSKLSIKKPWVKKELSVGLMRQLSDNSVRVIPILLDRVELPPILKDIKYADFTDKRDAGYQEAIKSLVE
jgi:hypothetical protein